MATQLLISILKVPDTGFIQGFLKMLNDALDNEKVQPSEDFRIKESIMYVLGAISEILGEDEELLKGMEMVLQDHVHMELSSNYPMMRA